MTTRKMLAILALGIFFSGAVVDDAAARAGRSSRSGSHSSTGWRGSRTPDSGGFQGTNQSRRQPAAQSQAAQGQRPSWFQRNPLLAGVMGAVAGSALFAMLGSAFGGFGGMGGGLMTMLLVAGVAMLAMRLFRSRLQPAFASGMRNGAAQGSPFAGQGYGGGTVTDVGAFRQSREQGLAAIALESPAFTTAKAEDELARIFFRVQEAWSADDRATLRTLATPEMFETYDAELTDMASRRERNVLKGIVVRAFEVTEAWQDADEEFITASIHARLLDYVERDGRIVEGSDAEPVEFREVWTFARPRRGTEWRLSAVNQV